MKLVEMKILNLEDHLGDSIDVSLKPRLNASIDSITLRQLLNFTSGLPSQPASFLKTDISLQASIAELLESLPRAFKPTGEFDYNDNHLQAASMMALKAFKKYTGIEYSFAELVQQVIGKPLQFSEIEYFAKPRQRKGNLNPRAAAGLRISFNDYGKFLQMIANDGVYNGQTVLSSETIREMSRAQVEVPNRPGFFYGFGNWRVCAPVAGCTVVENRSPGYSGWFPAINQTTKYIYLFGTAESGDATERSAILYESLQPYIEQLVKLENTTDGVSR
jgi:serine-type D-Ala-D-Ala carboxypeptidase